MKKLVALAFATSIAFSLFAQDKAADTTTKSYSTVWPSFFAVCEYPVSPDIVGLRLTIPFSTRQDNVTGLDIGFWGRSMNFEGFQFNLLRNDVKDSMSGLQCGLYNSIGRGEFAGVQVGLWNEAGAVTGIQAGLVNLAGSMDGFQFGLINRCETMYGFQVGLINVIRDAEVRFFPIANIGF